MKAFVVEHYGKDALRAADVPEPDVDDTDVLVKVSAASVNPLDAKIKSGEFKLILPYRLPLVLGNDMSGTVVRVAAGAGQFKPGDEVYARPDDERIDSVCVCAASHG